MTNPVIESRRLERPALHDETVDVKAVVGDLLDHLNNGLDAASADTYDDMFADDILWGSPKGQVLQGFAPLNAVHRQLMSAQVAPESTFERAAVVAPAPGIVVAQIGRHARDGGFSEMAMYVLVERDGQWWVAGAQNTPIVDTLPAR
ncbi:hypothetical protein GTV32_19260 [Gordonia sp. SID5947]|uniref:DUF4440 domain-containing protein n=1 Tax=Gordonia sp. SID5947 TaxID=2690315 RepID=UPI0013718579|nr:DUF4440 domain-containing protein [Gordonia sp. SID5947]MYR08306.1 hypothetical protein [Gordonia sp. SID5947]